jgi:cysteine synthase B
MYKTIGDLVGDTPLVQLVRMGSGRNILLAKLEGNNPAGSVKDRPALSMIAAAEARGDIKPGDTLIEATSGNTGIALAMGAAVKGYRMVLIMPDNMTEERRGAMRAFGAELVLVSKEQGMEYARDLALQMQASGEGKVLDQFANPDNPLAHYQNTGPEIWRETNAKVSHFVSTMGTTGTIMGCSRYFKEQSAEIQIIGVQPDGESSIPGIRKWQEPYLPKILDASRIDRIIEVDAADAEHTTRRMGREEGIFAGVSSGGACFAALQLDGELEGATIVFIVCDRGDRYLSSGVFGAG